MEDWSDQTSELLYVYTRLESATCIYQTRFNLVSLMFGSEIMAHSLLLYFI